jgi:hypothetical protein
MNTLSFGTKIANSHFSRKEVATLRKRGIVFTGTTFLPNEAGDYTKGETGYLIDDNGTGRCRNFAGVMDLLGKKFPWC